MSIDEEKKQQRKKYKNKREWSVNFCAYNWCCWWWFCICCCCFILFIICYSLFICTCHKYTHLMTCQVLYPGIEKKWENSIKSQAKPEKRTKATSQSRKIKHVVRWFSYFVRRPFTSLYSVYITYNNNIHIYTHNIHTYIFSRPYTIFYLLMVLKLKQFPHKQEPTQY